MSKKAGKLRIAAPAPLGTVCTPINYDLCCICQTKAGALQCSADNPVSSRRNLGYVSLAVSLEKIRAISPSYVLPSGLGIQCLDEGEGFESTLRIHKAKWHKKCVRMFEGQQLETILESLSQSGAEDDVNSDTEEIIDEDPYQEKNTAESARPRTRARSENASVNLKEDLCLFCKSPATWNKPLYRCATTQMENNLKKAAENAGDLELLGELSHGDLPAKEAKYHSLCLVRLYNQSRAASAANNATDHNTVMCEGIAFADLILYIQSKLSESSSYIFRMGELRKMYTSRLEQLFGGEVGAQQTTRLRLKILAHFPNLRAEKPRNAKEYVLVPDTANIFSNIPREDHDEDALAFQRFARNLRRAISAVAPSFQGSFEKGCEEACVPPPLLGAISTILYGAPFRTICDATKPAIRLCELIVLNFKETMPRGNIVRHKKEREPPLPLYVGLSCYARGRQKSWIDELHNLGISVSSNRIMEVTSQLCHLVVRRSNEEDFVCPWNLQQSLFTVAALDNIDLKSTSTSGQGEFHGTGISVFQLPQKGEKGTARNQSTALAELDQSSTRNTPALPDSYALIPECTLPNEKPPLHGEHGRNLVRHMVNRGKTEVGFFP